MIMLRFFFSSRRRHTRLVSDWSSDVCSSDLNKVHILTANSLDLIECTACVNIIFVSQHYKVIASKSS